MTTSHAASVAALGLGLLLAAGGLAQADRIKNPTAVFAGLDKITGRIVSFEVAINETVQFGTLQVTPKACFTRPPTEAPQTTTFVQIDETAAGSQPKRIFGGWMYSSSPGLHALEHPIYDVWLTDCKGGNPEKDLVRSAPPDATATGEALPGPAPAAATLPVGGGPQLPPKPGTVPRRRPAAAVDTAGTTLPGAPLPGGESSDVTALPLPPPVPRVPQGFSPGGPREANSPYD